MEDFGVEVGTHSVLQVDTPVLEGNPAELEERRAFLVLVELLVHSGHTVELLVESVAMDKLAED